MTHIWLRAETKMNEYRTPITPATAVKLINLGYKITVEKSNNRCFDDSQYQAIGCELVNTNSWRTAPKDAYIVGLKELSKDVDILQHKHIYFAHCFKNQSGSMELMSKFIKGNGVILDLEYLVNDKGVRLATFGKSAGIAGALLSLMVWADQKITNQSANIGPLSPLKSSDDVLESLKQKITKINSVPKILVIGHKGRVGAGAMHFLSKLNIEPTVWSREETDKLESDNSMYSQILDHDILLNCINLDKKISMFVTNDMLENNNRKLSVCVDISCDYLNPYNPLPIYTRSSSFEEPVIKINDKPIFDIVSIDNLPSLLPVESSNDFAEQLYPHLAELSQWNNVWQKAEKVFMEKSI